LLGTYVRLKNLGMMPMWAGRPVVPNGNLL